MKIVVAQGNPGPDYQTTRHNIGFLIIDNFAEKHETSFKNKPKFHAEIAELSIGGEKILLVKPATFYNETGRSVRALVDFYKADTTNDLLVIHDDLALPFGTIRTRQQGSDAGNNGIKSISAVIGENYHRIRIGILNDLRDRMPDADFVLSHFTGEEQAALPDIKLKVNGLINNFVLGKLEAATHR